MSSLYYRMLIRGGHFYHHLYTENECVLVCSLLLSAFLLAFLSSACRPVSAAMHGGYCSRVVGIKL